MLSVPVVLAPKELNPTAVLLFAVVLASNAPQPIATFDVPVLLEKSES